VSSASKPATLGALKATGYRSRSVKQELRDNLRARLGARGRSSPASWATSER